MSEFILYKIDSPSGKSYIGYTSYDLKKRLREHKCSPYIIGKAIRKYGDLIKSSILAIVDSCDEAHTLEKFYIAMFNTKVPFGYNLTDGGEGVTGFKMPEDKKTYGRRVDTDDELATSLRQSGLTYVEISDIVGASPETITRRIKAYAENNSISINDRCYTHSKYKKRTLL